MRFRTQFAVAMGLAIGTGLGSMPEPVAAFTVTQNDNFSELLGFLLGNTTGLSNFTGSANGFDDAFGTFQADPFGLGQGVVLSTGDVEDIPGENTEDGRNNILTGQATDLSTAFENSSGSAPGELFDTATLEISFDADPTVDRLFFQYVFGSEEFLEFAGSQFNDFFTLELNGTNLALLNNSVGDDNFVRVNNLAQSVGGSFSPEYVDNPEAPGTVTRLDGFTTPLRFEGDVLTGSNTLRIQISDVSDAILDSAVFIQAGTLGITAPEPPPEPPVAEPPVMDPPVAEPPVMDPPVVEPPVVEPPVVEPPVVEPPVVEPPVVQPPVEPPVVEPPPPTQTVETPESSLISGLALLGMLGLALRGKRFKS